jgi:hypothetical protein
MPEPAQPSPQEKLASLLSSIQFDLNNLQSSVQLSSARDALEDMDARINGLPARIKDLRVRGYVFGKTFENKTADLRRRWLTVHSSVQNEISRQAPRLQAELSPLETQYVQVKSRAQFPSTALPAAERLKIALDTLENKVRSTESTIRGLYDSFSSEVSVFKTELDRVDWTLKQLAQGCFQLLATEGCVMAVEATFSRDDDKMEKDDAKGVLYLTDQRLIFEQKQEIATKKILFIATEKQKVQQVVLDVPVDMVEKVEAMKKGMFGNQDHLTILFKVGAPYRQVWFHLDGQDCQLWNGLIGRARTGDFNNDRAVAIDKKAEEKVRSAPSQCPNCGAPISATVLRGMLSITCEYCQFVIRL